MLSCAPPKPCDPRTRPDTVNHTKMAKGYIMAQSVISSLVIDTDGSSVVNLGDEEVASGPRVLSSSGKLTGAISENTIVPLVSAGSYTIRIC